MATSRLEQAIYLANNLPQGEYGACACTTRSPGGLDNGSPVCYSSIRR